jgi:very-short-patch-repair endonuclease
LVECGIPQSTITRWIDGARLIVFAPGTYLIAGSPATWNQKAMASALAVGPRAAVSHRGAAYLLDLGVRPPQQIHVTTPHGSHDGRLLAFVVHRARTLQQADIRIVGSIPVTCAERTLVDLAGTVALARLAAALDSALLAGLTSLDGCRNYIEERNLQNRRGTGKLMRLLADRESGVPESQLEREFLAVVEAFHLPVPIRQEAVGPYRVDFIYPDHGILIELDGRMWHGTAEAFHDDRTRQNRLALAGYELVLRFTWRHVSGEPSYVARTMSEALSAGRA